MMADTMVRSLKFKQKDWNGVQTAMGETSNVISRNQAEHADIMNRHKVIEAMRKELSQNMDVSSNTDFKIIRKLVSTLGYKKVQTEEMVESLEKESSTKENLIKVNLGN